MLQSAVNRQALHKGMDWSPIAIGIVPMFAKLSMCFGQFRHRIAERVRQSFRGPVCFVIESKKLFRSCIRFSFVSCLPLLVCGPTRSHQASYPLGTTASRSSPSHPAARLPGRRMIGSFASSSWTNILTPDCLEISAMASRSKQLRRVVDGLAQILSKGKVTIGLTE